MHRYMPGIRALSSDGGGDVLAVDLTHVGQRSLGDLVMCRSLVFADARDFSGIFLFRGYLESLVLSKDGPVFVDERGWAIDVIQSFSECHDDDHESKKDS